MPHPRFEYSYSITAIDPETRKPDPKLDHDFHVSVYGACSVPRVGDTIRIGDRLAKVEWVEHLVELIEDDERAEYLGPDAGNKSAAYAKPLVGVVLLKDPP